jgi:hypothetical protein
VTEQSPPVTPKDLTAINPAPSSGSPASDVVQAPTEVPYDPAPARENVRGTIALLLVWSMVGVIALVALVGVVTAYNCHVKDACTAETTDLKSIRSVIELVLTPLVGLVGAVTGFYFGEKSGNSKPNS